MTLDERTYDPGDGAMGADHPISWEHASDGGRAWYTALGHTDESYTEPLFLSFLLGGIRYAAAPSPAAALRIVFLTADVSGRRVGVTVKVSGCSACTATARLAIGKKKVSTRLRFSGATGTGALSPLPPGRGRVFVVVTDTAAGVSRTASHTVHIH
jgi:hypothetical protein